MSIVCTRARWPVLCSSMKFGIAILPTDCSIGVAELVPAVEERGFESFWVGEHTHIPTSRVSPFPGGNELPEHYLRILDPFVALTVAAQHSSRLVLGFGISLIVQRDPITTAKAIASLDFVSGGRIVLGVGTGWNLEELRNHGIEPGLRFRLLRERVLAMREIWTHDEAEFHGELVDFDAIWSWPKPVQARLPVYIGGNGKSSMRRAVDFADGWMPSARRDALSEQVPVFRRMCEESGRGLLPVTASGTKHTAEDVEFFHALGVDRINFWLPSGSRDEVMHSLEAVTGLARRAV
jgi:probable F420-dependent oxidoreductase